MTGPHNRDMLSGSRPKICLYTPLFGDPSTASVAHGYHLGVCKLIRTLDVDFLDSRMFTSCDLTIARSRAVRSFLFDRPDATHLLHWDADVVGNPSALAQCLRGMLATGHDLVGAPYPRKRIHWERIAAGGAEGARSAEDLEALAHDYPYLLVGPEGAGEGESRVDVVAGCVEVDALAFGFTLTSRHCLERMWSAYAPSLSFGDVLDGEPRWTVALFHLLLPGQRDAAPFAVGPMLSEDYSFCSRWRMIGGSVHMYVGAGSPLHHVGPAVFRGRPEGVVWNR